MTAILIILKENKCVIRISCPTYAKVKSYGCKCDKFHSKNILGWWVEVNLVRKKFGGGGGEGGRNSEQILIIFYVFLHSHPFR